MDEIRQSYVALLRDMLSPAWQKPGERKIVDLIRAAEMPARENHAERHVIIHHERLRTMGVPDHLRCLAAILDDPATAVDDSDGAVLTFVANVLEAFAIYVRAKAERVKESHRAEGVPLP